MSLAPNNKVETHKTNKDESSVCCNTEPIVESLAQRNSKENSNETLNAGGTPGKNQSNGSNTSLESVLKALIEVTNENHFKTTFFDGNTVSMTKPPSWVTRFLPDDISKEHSSLAKFIEIAIIRYC